MRVSLFDLLTGLMALLCATITWPAWSQTDSFDARIAIDLRMQAVALEYGEGVPRNLPLAAATYCKGARLGDPDAQYSLGWMYANGRGVARDDATAAYFFDAAAKQGLLAAKRMLTIVGQPAAEIPECMREPAKPPPVTPGSVQVARPTVDYRTIAPRYIVDLVMKMAPEYQVEPQLALAIMAAESNFDSSAQSPRNAQGLMQLIPETSERFKVQNPFNPAQNIRGGLTYLRWLLAYFEGDVALVAAAYNAGEGTIERYHGVPPYPETRAYVQRIIKSVGAQIHPYNGKITRPSPLLSLTRLSGEKK